MSAIRLAPAEVEIVEQALATAVRSISVRGHPYATSHTIVEVDAELVDGRTISAVVKDTSVRLAFRPGFVHRACRERDVYQRVLQPSAAPAPRLLGVCGPHVVLERLSGVPLWQAAAGEVAGRLGAAAHALHDRTAGSIRSPFLVRYDRRFYERWLRRACILRPSLAELSGLHARAVDRLLREPQVVIHGELYPSNVLVGSDLVAFVDWETAAAGPAAVDVAALICGWSERDAHALLAAYGHIDPTALDCARLHLALRWLGWSTRWSPPREQTWDWEGEAWRSAGRLRGRLT